MSIPTIKEARTMINELLAEQERGTIVLNQWSRDFIDEMQHFHSLTPRMRERIGMIYGDHL